MPTYDFDCASCGPFTAFRPMSAYADPAPCDACGTPAPRAFFTAPAIFGMDAATRRGLAVNERSRHEPRRARHAPGCGCCTRTNAPAAAIGAAKSFPGARPWMISH